LQVTVIGACHKKGRGAPEPTPQEPHVITQNLVCQCPNSSAIRAKRPGRCADELGHWQWSLLAGCAHL